MFAGFACEVVGEALSFALRLADERPVAELFHPFTAALALPSADPPKEGKLALQPPLLLEVVRFPSKGEPESCREDPAIS